VASLKGGANSQVFLLEGCDGLRFCAKLHPLEADGSSPRYDREKRFYEAARQNGKGWMPGDVYWDDVWRVGCFEFIAGTPVAEATIEDVGQAGEFIRVLQCVDRGGLKPASEAALNPEDHVAMVDRRLAAMEAITDGEAADFVANELRPRWEKLRCRVDSRPSAVILSPSDFGFHNALRRPSGRLCFFDFEHAGLDDPAKLVCDFFVRPEANLPFEWVDVFCQAAGFCEDVRTRALELADLQRIKWACIVLNEFAEEGRRRRGFAGVDMAGRRETQLSKARALMGKMSA